MSTQTDFIVEHRQGPGAANFRTHQLWRPDNRYPGYVMVRRHESGGVELSFDALREGAKPRPPVIVDPGSVDALILSLLEVRSGEWVEDTDEGQR